MTEIRVEIHGLQELQRRFGASGPIVGAEIEKAMKASVVHLEREVKPLTPVGATGEARSTITHAVEKGPGGRTVGMVGGTRVYLPFLETGTKPHWPPFAPIAYWVQRVLAPAAKEFKGVVRAIQVSIATYGTSRQAKKLIGTMGYRMFERGFEEAKGFIEKQFEAAIDRILGRLAK